MVSLSGYVIILMSAFLAIYLPLQKQELAEAFPKSARLITAAAWAGCAGFIVFAGWLAILLKSADTSNQAIKVPAGSLWIGGVALAVALCCVSVAAYFQIRNISQQRERRQLRIQEDQEKLQRLDEELSSLGIRLPDDQDQPPTSTK